MTNPSASTSNSFMDVEFEFENKKRQRYQEMLEKHSIFIPQRYLPCMIQSGLMDSFIHIIHQVDKEIEEIKDSLKNIATIKRSHDSAFDNDDNVNEEEIKRPRIGDNNDNDDNEEEIIQSILDWISTIFLTEDVEDTIEGQTHYLDPLYEPVNSSNLFKELLVR